MAETELKVLIVDDDEDMRATLSDFISRMGVKVRTAGDVPEAREALAGETPPFDLVLADLKLPEGTGLDVLRAAHARSVETLVTIVTGYASLETAIDAIRLGAYDYITKPFSLDEIGVQVRNMISRVSLAKENARLSLRLQDLFQQVSRLQSERSELNRFYGDIRKELQENNRKLDLLLAVSQPKVTFGNAAAGAVGEGALNELFREIERLDRMKKSGGASSLDLEGRKRNLIEDLVDRL
jgi:DNA-binding NtrC family response regulator